MRAALLALVLLVAGCGGSAPSSSAPSSAAPSAPSASSGPPARLRLVAIGDSIPMNAPADCPGCTGFVDQFAAAVGKAHGVPVDVDNRAQHNSLTLPMLLAELDQLRGPLGSADVIVVGIAHNSNELSSDVPCGTPIGSDGQPVWSVMTTRCAQESARTYRPMYDRIFGAIAALRSGRPTLLRTIDRYNDVIGAPGSHLTPAVERTTATFVRTWDGSLCASARAHGFGCADLGTAFNGSDGLRPSGDLLGPDYVHPSQRGHDLIARTLLALGTDLAAGR